MLDRSSSERCPRCLTNCKTVVGIIAVGGGGRGERKEKRKGGGGGSDRRETNSPPVLACLLESGVELSQSCSAPMS